MPHEYNLAFRRKYSRRAAIREIMRKMLERGDIEPTGEMRNGQPAYRLTEQGMKKCEQLDGEGPRRP